MHPEWIGEVAYVLQRCGITAKELSMEMGVSNSYLSALMNERRSCFNVELKVKNALRSCVESRGLKYEDVFPYARSAEGSDS